MGGLRMKRTPQRLAVIEYLKHNQCHPSIMDIHRAIADKFPTTSIATIYSIMDTLVRDGQVNELSIDPSKKRFDTNLASHYHLLCKTCGEIIDFRDEVELALPKNRKDSFLVTDQQITYYGTCLSCQAIMQSNEMEHRHEESSQTKWFGQQSA